MQITRHYVRFLFFMIETNKTVNELDMYYNQKLSNYPMTKKYDISFYFQKINSLVNNEEEARVLMVKMIDTYFASYNHKLFCFTLTFDYIIENIDKLK